MASGIYEISEEEYLAREPQAEYKSEYRHGKLIAMSGASPSHVRIMGNIYFALRRELAGKPCEVFSSDLRVKVAAALYTYPDISVVCGEARFDSKDLHSLVNPSLIIEILSPSTQEYDRGEKFNYYKALKSLQTYVLVSQDEVSVEVFTRKSDWARSSFVSLSDVVTFDSVECNVSIEEIYARINPAKRNQS